MAPGGTGIRRVKTLDRGSATLSLAGESSSWLVKRGIHANSKPLLSLLAAAGHKNINPNYEQFIQWQAN